MPAYVYKAKEGPEKIVQGTIDAQNRNSAIQAVAALGLTPLDVVPAGEDSPAQELKTARPALDFSFSRRISPALVVSFTREMSDLVDAAVPVLRALQIVSRQIRRPHFKKIVDATAAFVENGGSFSQALAQYPRVFPNFYVRMVKAAEAAGRLGDVLKRLAAHLEKEQEIRGRVQSSLAYPLLIFGAGILTVVVLLVFVIPRLAVMFDDLNQDLPWPTVFLVKTSAFFVRYGWFIAAVTTVAAVYANQWRRLPQGRRWFDRLQLKTPFLGDFIKIVTIGRLARTLGTLLENGVAVTTALETAAQTVDNTVIRGEIERVSREVAGGATFKAALRQTIFFPETTADMIAVAEETGRLDQGLYKIAETFERQADRTVQMMLSLLGPVVLIAVVAVVGFAVIAMLLPIFQMNLLIQ